MQLSAQKKLFLEPTLQYRSMTLINNKKLSMKSNSARVLRSSLLLLSCLSLSGCSGMNTSIEDPVEWWAVKGWGNPVTIELYDNNCGRYLRDIEFKRNDEIKVVSCGDGQGQANIRYRREGYPSRTPSWGRDTLLRANQRAIVR